MANWNLKALSLSLAVLAASFVPVGAAQEKPIDLNELQTKRKAVRAELMLPSLVGMKGLSYRVVGYKNAAELDKLFGARLARLGIPCVSFLKMEEGYKPVDGIVQITVYKFGNATMGEVNLTQWVTLERDAKVRVRAVTYKDRMFFGSQKPEQVVQELADTFVFDYLQANQKNFTGGQASSKVPADKPAAKKK